MTGVQTCALPIYSEYVGHLKARMNDRLEEIKAFSTEKGGYDKLPDDALAAIQKVVDELN